MTDARMKANARMGITAVDRATAQQLAVTAARSQIRRGVTQFRKAMELRAAGKYTASLVYVNAAMATLNNLGAS